MSWASRHQVTFTESTHCQKMERSTALFLHLLLLVVVFFKEGLGLKCWHTGKTTAVSLIILEAIGTKSPIFSIWYCFLAHTSSKFPKRISFENSTSSITGLCFSDQREICAGVLNLELSLWNPYLDNFSQQGGNQIFVLRTALIGWSGTDPGEKLSRDRSAVCQRSLHCQPDVRRLLQARSWCSSWQCRSHIVIFT